MWEVREPDQVESVAVKCDGKPLKVMESMDKGYISARVKVTSQLGD